MYIGSIDENKNGFDETLTFETASSLNVNCELSPRAKTKSLLYQSDLDLNQIETCRTKINTIQRVG